MKSLVRWINHTSAPAHLVRTLRRYGNRLGEQFAGAITFYSVMSMVPILMFAFGALGLTLTVIRPQWLGVVKEVIGRNITDNALRTQVLGVLDRYLYNWRAISVFAAITAAHTGVTWTAHLKEAVRGMWRPEFDLKEQKHPFFIEYVINLGILFTLLVLAGVSFTANALGSSISANFATVIGLDKTILNLGVVRILSLFTTLICGWVLFYFLYRVLPAVPAPVNVVRKAALVAAILFYLLQQAFAGLTGMLGKVFGNTLFGPVLLSMLFLSYFARLILFMAAWIATTNQPAVARRYHASDLILMGRKDIVAADGHWEAARRDFKRKRKTSEGTPGPTPDFPSNQNEKASQK